MIILLPSQRTLVVRKTYSIGAYNSAGMLSDNPHAGIYEATTSRTLDLNGGNPACNQGGIMILEEIVLNDQGGQQMTVTYNVVSTLRAQEHGHQSLVLDKKESKLEDNKDVAACNFRNFSENEDVNGTLCAKPNGGYSENNNQDVRVGYRVRRLTPTECGRLQGFPDGWCDDIAIDNPTQEDIDRWREIFAENGKNKSDKQITRFLKNPHSDSAEYKMWGNGMALPCVLYVMEGLAEAGGVQIPERHERFREPEEDGSGNFHFYSFQRSDQLSESNVASTMQARQWKDATDLIVE